MSTSFDLARQLVRQLATERPDLVPLASRLLRQLRPCRHSADFASVAWRGKTFSFTGSQSVVVRELWRAWSRETPELRQETLLAAAGSDAGRLSDLFKGHPAWNVLIVPGASRGTFRLADLPEESHGVP